MGVNVMSKGATDLVRASVLAPCVRILRGNAAQLQAVFAEAGIPIESIEDPEAWLAKPLVYRFAGIAARVIGDRTFGARAGLEVSWRELGPFGDAIQRAASLADAGERARLNLRFSATGAACWVESRRGSAWFCYRPEVRFEEGADQAELYDLGILLQFVRRATGPEWRPRRLRVVTCSPDLVRQVHDFSEARILIDSSATGVAFPARCLNAPLEWDRTENRDEWRERSAPDGTLRDAVRRILASLLPYGNPPALTSVAEMMGLHPRTLERMLSAEETTFREILNSVRHETALDLLETTDAPVKEIARHLGYSGPSNFVRAFQQASGRTPGAVRRAAGRESVTHRP